jgi:hypothetical protein
MPAQPDVTARVAKIRELAEHGARHAEIAARVRLCRPYVITIMREHNIKLGAWTPERKAKWQAFLDAEATGGI